MPVSLKYVGCIGQRIECVAAEEERAGHRTTAFELIYVLSMSPLLGQHLDLEMNDEKRHPADGRCLGQRRKGDRARLPIPSSVLKILFEGAELQ